MTKCTLVTYRGARRLAKKYLESHPHIDGVVKIQFFCSDDNMHGTIEL